MSTIYAGPGFLFFNSVALWPQGENGKITYVLQQEKNDASHGMRGRVASTLGNTEGKISLTPFDNWGLIPTLFPTFIGASNGANAGLLAIGQRPHNPGTVSGSGSIGALTADMPGVIWNPQGSGVSIKRVAITKHPDLHLGVDKPLYGAMELTSLPSSTSGASPVAVGSAAAFHTISENGLANPDSSAGTVSDFIREAWVGSISGGPTGFAASLEAEEEWTITADIKYNAPKKQKQTMAYTLASVQFMAKCRPYGPTWTNIEAAVATGRATGSRWGVPTSNAAPVTELDLVLTSTTGKTVTLYNVDFFGEGQEFGGAGLNTGEVGFVTQLVEAGGVASRFIAFSS